MKKRYFLIVILFIFSLFGCKNKSDDKLHIVTTIFPIYDFVREIKTDDFEVSMLLHPGQEVHTYDPSAKDIANIYESELFIYIGGESDSYVDTILKNNKNVKALKLIDFVDALEEEEEDHEHDHSHDAIEYDEHIWTSIRNAVKMVKAISNSMLEIKDDEQIVKNTNEYISKLEALDLKFSEIVNNAKTNIMVFADRFPFLYFAHDYNLNCYKAFPGCSTETEASAKKIKELVDVCRNNNLGYVYYIDLSNKNVAKAVSKDANVDMLLFHSVQNVTLDEFKSETYLSLMKNNAIALEKGLNNE